MAPVTEIHLDAPPAVVFDVLCDPETYPRWLLGAQRIRHVEHGWPAPGTSFHHQVGLGPLHLKDRTTALDVEDERRLVLRAGIGPVGAATVRFEVEPEGAGAHLRLIEEPRSGPLRRVWDGLSKVLVWTGVKVRNDLSVQQLADVVAERNEAG